MPHEQSGQIERIELVQGDITALHVEAIVNAAKSSLLGGGGVDGAIHAAAGHQLLEECRTLHGCATGDAKITQGYHLPAAWIIHTVGPVWFGGWRHEDQQLASCYRSSLALATEHGIHSVAFPAISTGIYHFPLARATRIALETTLEWVRDHNLPERVIFVCFNQAAYDVYAQVLRELRQP